MTEMMRVMDAGGQAIKLSTAPKPRPGPNEVLVRVVASAVNPAEEKVFRGDFAVEVPIDSRYTVADLHGAFHRQTDRGRVGRVVVDVAGGWPA
jgi:NADPH:quinone reductase-like Zn-dependent oxidoreductase